MIRESILGTAVGKRRVLDAGSGWPVVLLHAFPLTADMWRPQLARVADGWRIIAPDLRGFGPVARDQPAVTMDDMALDVAAILDALEIERATIGGLSMGGYVTFALFRMARERFSGMVLADTRSQADTADGRTARAKMLEQVRTGGPSAVAGEMLPKLLSETTRRERQEIPAQVRTMIEANTPEAIAGAIQAMMARPDSTPLLPEISVPTLIVVGEEDMLTPPADAESLQRQINRSRLVVLPAAGHLSNVETPDTFSQAVADFLASNI